MNRRVNIDPQAFINETNIWIDRLTKSAEKLDRGRFTEILGRWRNVIKERIDQPYTVVICGEFNRGKSSLINALLGEDVVPVDVLPETITYNTLAWGPHCNEAILPGGRRMRLADDELQRDELLRLNEEQNVRIQQLILHRPNPVLKDINIIDTPGMNEMPDSEHNMLKDVLERADLVIYVMTPGIPLSLTEQSFLRNLVLPNPTLSLLLVCNKADQVDTQQLGRLEDAIARKIARFLPGNKVYYVSAAAERIRQNGGCLLKAAADPDTLNTLFDAFRIVFEKNLEEKKDIVLLSRTEHLVTACIADLEEEIEVIRLGADKDLQQSMENEQQTLASLEKSNEELAYFSDLLTKRIREMEIRAKDEQTEVLGKMRAETAILDEFSEADIEKYYSFYCIDTVREVLRAQMERDEEEIFDMIRQAPILDFLHLPDMPLPDFCFDLDSRVWTKGDTLSYAGSLFARGMLANMLTTYVSGLLREREKAGQTKSLKEKILDIYPSFYKSVSDGIHNVYEGFEKDILKQLKIFAEDKALQMQERRDEIENLKSLSDEERTRICEMADVLDKEVKAMKAALI